MATFEFTPTTDFIVLKFRCPYCGENNETEALDVPTPDFSAETHHDSVNTENYEHLCPECNHIFNINIYNGFYGGDGDISDIDDNSITIEEHSPEDDYEEEYKSMYFDEHVRDTIDVLDKIDMLDETAQKLLYRTLYANVISSMEAFLSDRLIQKVLSSNGAKRQFVENFKDFKETQIPISEIYKSIGGIESQIKKVLREIIYHNLPRVKHIYKSTLNIDLGDISELMKCISIRHDIVHRNGKDKDGNTRNITKEDVITLAHNVTDFIRNIESQISMIGHINVPLRKTIL